MSFIHMSSWGFKCVIYYRQEKRMAAAFKMFIVYQLEIKV